MCGFDGQADAFGEGGWVGCVAVGAIAAFKVDGGALSGGDGEIAGVDHHGVGDAFDCAATDGKGLHGDAVGAGLDGEAAGVDGCVLPVGDDAFGQAGCVVDGGDGVDAVSLAVDVDGIGFEGVVEADLATVSCIGDEVGRDALAGEGAGVDGEGTGFLLSAGGGFADAEGTVDGGGGDG